MRNLQVALMNTESKEPITIALSDNLTSASAIDFKNDLVNIIGEKKRDCHINISNLNQMDVTGVNALAMAHKAANRMGRTMVLISNDHNPADEFLHLTKFKNYFNFSRA